LKHRLAESRSANEEPAGPGTAELEDKHAAARAHHTSRSRPRPDLEVVKGWAKKRVEAAIERQGFGGSEAHRERG
jgi:hypothetical protein